MRRHWYFITIHACPVCCREKVYRERRYGRRPKKAEDRRECDFHVYDNCMDGSFL